jgi:hypothetical protein
MDHDGFEVFDIDDYVNVFFGMEVVKVLDV